MAQRQSLGQAIVSLGRQQQREEGSMHSAQTHAPRGTGATAGDGTTLCASLELSHTTWLVTILSPGTASMLKFSTRRETVMVASAPGAPAVEGGGRNCSDRRHLGRRPRWVLGTPAARSARDRKPCRGSCPDRRSRTAAPCTRPTSLTEKRCYGHCWPGSEASPEYAQW